MFFLYNNISVKLIRLNHTELGQNDINPLNPKIFGSGKPVIRKLTVKSFGPQLKDTGRTGFVALYGIKGF